MLLADLDHFKSINDRFGHAVGDHVLQIFAEAAGAKLGPLDLIGRLGGEEFAIVHLRFRPRQRSGHRRTHPPVVRERRRRGRWPSDRRYRQHGHGDRGDELFDIAALLAQADEALYCAKERGRNRTEVASLQLVLDRRARRPSSADAPAAGRGRVSRPARPESWR